MSESSLAASDGHMLISQNCNRVDILVEEAELGQSEERFSSRPDRAYKRQICRAISSGDWGKASSYDRTHPNWVRTPLNGDKDTALHLAVSLEQTTFVQKLVERLSMQDMEIGNASQCTAFSMAAMSGNVEIATFLLRKNPRLAWIRGHNGMLPIQLAFSAAQRHMVKFLFGITQQDMHIADFPCEDITKLFFLALACSIYTAASILLDKYPKLACTENEKGLTALEVLAQLSSDKDALGYRDIMHLLFKHVEEEDFLDSERASKAMFDAATSGNFMILDFILKYKPNLLMKMNNEGQSLLHIAVLHRQEPVYRLILSKGAYKHAIMQEVDSKGNNVLHFAGMLPAEAKFASPLNHALIHDEEMWFKEVESIVPPALKTMRNANGLTPEELFLIEHKELSEKAASDLHEMANTFLLVATLIVTLGITGGLTIRTNNIEGKTPFLSQKTWYMIYILSSVVGIAMCAVSMLFFVSAILCSVFWQKGVGYVSSRIIRVITGCWVLLISVGIMVIFSTTSGVALVYNFSPRWVLCTVVALGGVGFVLIYLLYRYPMYYSLQLLLSRCEKATAALRIRLTIPLSRALFSLFSGRWFR